MKKNIIFLGIILSGAFLMGLPYFLREGDKRLESLPSIIDPSVSIDQPIKEEGKLSESLPPLIINPSVKIEQPIRLKKELATPAPIFIGIKNFAFTQENLTIKKGTTVTWTNNDDLPHTVTTDVGGASSPTLSKGTLYSFTFDTIGNFGYHCAFHPSMKAMIKVIN